MSTLLEGQQVKFRTAADRKKLVGKQVKYLRRCDVDRSGRGYIFPRTGRVEFTTGRYVEFDNGTGVMAGDFLEIILLEDQQ